jgi:hypothetical protein
MDLLPLKAARRSGLLEWLIAAISALTLIISFRLWWRLLGLFWDISVYERAALDYSRGIDAYRTDAHFPFVYHPLVLRVLARFEALISLELLLPTLTLAAAGWLIVELLRAGAKPSNQGQAHQARDPGIIVPTQVGLGLVAAAGFGGIGIPALMSGNLSPLMHFALLAALVRGRSASDAISRYLPYGLIFLFALVKPYMLIYLGATVLLYRPRMTAMTCSALTAALFALSWLSFKARWPAEYNSFVANLSGHVLARGDIGYTFFYFFLSLTRKIPLALALHAVISCLLIALVMLLFTQKYGSRAPFVPQLMLVYLVLTLANPRMKDYDLFPALAGFFTVFGLISARAALITFAGSSLASIPLLFRLFAPEIAVRHPRMLDPFGNWQLIGLAVIAILLLVELQDEQRAPLQPATGLAEPAQEPPAARS